MTGIPVTEQDRKDALVVKEICLGKSAREAVVAAGYSVSTAQCRATQIVERAIKKSPMIEALDRVGVTTERLARTVKRGLRAKKTQRLVVGSRVETFEDIDHGTRHRYLETAVRLRGEDPDRSTTTTEETFEQRVRRLRAGMALPQQQAAPPLDLGEEDGTNRSCDR